MKVNEKLTNETLLIGIATTNSFNVGSGNLSIHNFNNIDILDNSFIEDDNNSITIKKGGYYKISYIMRFYDGSADVFGGITINDADDDSYGVWSRNTGRLSISGTIILNLNQNDNIKILTHGTAVSNMGIIKSTFWLEYISE